MLRLLCVVLVFLSVCLVAADDSGFDDVVVCHKKPKELARFVRALKGDVCVTCVDAEQDLHDAFAEQLLDGFYFKETVPMGCQADPRMLDEGVREVACNKRPFTSEGLRACFAALEEALRCKDSATPRKERVCFSDIYPEGFCRLWNVLPTHVFSRMLQEIPQDDVRDSVFVSLRGSFYALRGDLLISNNSARQGMARVETECEQEKASLLQVKRWQEKQGVMSFPKMMYGAAACESLGLSAFVKIPCSAEQSIGVVCVREDGSFGAIFPAGEFTMPSVLRKGNVASSETLFHFMRRQILQGYVPYSAEKFDADLVENVSARKAICYKKSFFSRDLVSVLQMLPTLCSPVHVGGPGFWCMLTAKHCEEIGSDGEVQWGILDTAEGPDMGRLLLKSTPGTVFVMFQDEPDILRGVAASVVNGVAVTA